MSKSVNFKLSKSINVNSIEFSAILFVFRLIHSIIHSCFLRNQSSIHMSINFPNRYTTNKLAVYTSSNIFKFVPSFLSYMKIPFHKKTNIFVSIQFQYYLQLQFHKCYSTNLQSNDYISCSVELGSMS